MLSISVSGSKRHFDLDKPDLPDWVEENAFQSGHYPYEKKLDKDAYKSKLEALQLQLVRAQAHRLETGQRIIILFEGRDAAGKGGTIGAFTEYMNHRHTRTVALPKPSETESGQWYYQRYIDHFPTRGEMVLFDRSWYNRAGVEPVMGFCTREEHVAFLHQTPHLERMIVEEGIALFKIWLNVGQEMQIKRFHDRRHNPMKRWKLSPMDLEALQRWDAYTIARNQMFAATHTDFAPWTVIRSNDKRRARLEAIRHVLHGLDYAGKDLDVLGRPDPLIVGQPPHFASGAGE